MREEEGEEEDEEDKGEGGVSRGREEEEPVGVRGRRRGGEEVKEEERETLSGGRRRTWGKRLVNSMYCIERSMKTERGGLQGREGGAIMVRRGGREGGRREERTGRRRTLAELEATVALSLTEDLREALDNGDTAVAVAVVAGDGGRERRRTGHSAGGERRVRGRREGLKGETRMRQSGGVRGPDSRTRRDRIEATQRKIFIRKVTDGLVGIVGPGKWSLLLLLVAGPSDEPAGKGARQRRDAHNLEGEMATVVVDGMHARVHGAAVLRRSYNELKGGPSWRFAERRTRRPC